MAISVLLVGDHPIVRQQLKTLLHGQPGFEVWCETGPNAARRLLQIEKVDVLVMDSQLPTLNGIKTIEAIRNKPHDPPVILLSSHTDLRYVKACLSRGIDGYLLRESAYEEAVAPLRSR